MSSVCALKTSRVDLAQALELVVAQDRVRRSRAAARARASRRAGCARSRRCVCDAHHDRLADRVDRRVRHLREQLLEVRVEERPPVGEHGERRVVAHRADRLLGVRARAARGSPSCPPACSRTRAAAGAAARPATRGGRARGRSARRTCSRSNHSPYGCCVATSRFTSSSATIRPCSRSTRKILPGCRRPLRTTFSGGIVEHAGLGREHDPAVLRLEPAAGPQAVAVERRADHARRR